MAVTLSPLMQPFAIGKVVLPNRFVMPSMQRGWVEQGVPLPVYVDYFRQRAEGGVGLINTEACSIDHPGSTGRKDAVVLCEATMDMWSRCLEGVHGAGSKMFLQIVHDGALRDEGIDGPYPEAPTISPSGLMGPCMPKGRACTGAEMEEIREAFVRGAVGAKVHGFDGVEIHAAHGFLLDQFLWRETNLRTDGYGGPNMADRVRFPAEVVAAVRSAVGPDFPISFRFSNWKSVDFDAHIVSSPEELGIMLAALRRAGVDAFHVSVRRFWVPEWPGSDWGLAGWVKSMTDAAVITVGSVGISLDFLDNMTGSTEAQSSREVGLAELIERFNGGQFDLVSIGRGLLADPHWISKASRGDFDAIRIFSRADLLQTIGGELPESYAR